jgi:hypothetical protein
MTGITTALELAVGVACLVAGSATVRSRGGVLRVAGIGFVIAGAIAVVHAAIAWI